MHEFELTADGAGMGVPVRRRLFVRHVFSVATAAALLAVWLLAGSATAWAAEAHFVPEASEATWDGNVVTVTFREEGVEAGTEASILVDARGSIDGSCTKDGAVVVSTHSSAAVTDVSDYAVNPDGTVTATRELAMKVHPPIINGLGCTMHLTNTFTVLLRDIDTGATLKLP